MKYYKIINYSIAAIWFIYGLFCKVLNFVPRHQQIVSKILSNEYSSELTRMIGVAEVLMAIWIISGYKSRLNAYIQMLVIVTMNCIEFFLAPELLLWGRVNSIYAAMLVLIIYLNEFLFKKEKLYSHS